MLKASGRGTSLGRASRGFDGLRRIEQGTSDFRGKTKGSWRSLPPQSGASSLRAFQLTRLNAFYLSYINS
jgi:hypothetical protein